MGIRISTRIIMTVFVLIISLLSLQTQAQLRMYSGSYVGNGVDDRLISGIGFQPDMVIVKQIDASNEAQIRLSNMPDGISKQMVGSTTAYLDRIQSFDADGFVVGVNNDVNAIGKNYIFMAFQTGSKFVIGTYNGDGTTGRPIDGLGFQPDLVYLIPSNDQRVTFKTSTIPGANAASFGGDFTMDNSILSLDADGFTVGSNARANKLGTDYYYAAFQASPNSLKVGSYLGNGIDGKAITGVGFKSDYIFMKGTNGSYACQTSSAMPNGRSVEFASSSTDDNRIRDVNNDGFVVGTQAQVNTNNVTYHYVCFNDYYFPPSTCIATGRYVGDGLINREVVGVGFRPAVVIVKSAASNEAQIRTNTMNEGGSKQMTGTSAIYSNRISSFTEDGFIVGKDADVNALSKKYNFVAFDNSPLIYTGTYTGNGVSGRAITGLPFQPGMVFVMASGSGAAHWRSRTFVNTNCSNFGSTAMTISATILSLTLDGFTVGSSTKANGNGLVYHYVAFKEDPAFLKLGSYLGTGVTGRFVDVPGIDLKFLMMKSEKSGSTLQKNELMDANKVAPFSGAEATGRINYMGMDGYEVTNNSLVNTLGTNYHYAAFQLCTNNGQGIWYKQSAQPTRSVPVSSNNMPELFTANDADEMAVFPNPATNLTTLKIASKVKEEARIALVDFSGRIVSERTVQLLPGVNNFSINLNGLTSGTYAVKLVKNNRSKAMKLIVNK